MTILIDMDDVLVNTTEAWVAHLNALFGTHVEYEKLSSFDVSLPFAPHTREEVYATQAHEEFWRRSEPLPGAVEAVTKLKEKGHRLYVVSNSQYVALQVKMEELLFRYFPCFTWKDVILTACKQMIRGDVLIDDAPHNLTGGEYEKLLFTAPHNRTLDAAAAGLIRVNDWSETLSWLEEHGEG